MSTVTPADMFNYYVGNVYWNDFDLINNRFNELISGDKSLSWHQSLLKDLGKFESGFFINCGNGWVERECFKEGLIGRAVAFDFSNKSIEEAKQKADDLGMPSEYFVCDCNKFRFSGKSQSLVVNYAAMHHAAYINHLTYNLAMMLKPTNGYYVGFDYIGPHRNQYPWEMWSAIVETNNGLPEKYRAILTYPHLKTMLHNDPTEAVHSEIQVEVLKRYFNIKKFIPLGGAIAYELLLNNKNLYKDRNTLEGKVVIEKIIEVDKAFCNAYPHLNLFAFWVTQPKGIDFPNPHTILDWQSQEDQREILASRNNGRYSEETALEIIYDDFDVRRRNAVTDLEERYNSLSSSYSTILKSKSWRYTAVLRNVIRWFS